MEGRWFELSLPVLIWRVLLSRGRLRRRPAGLLDRLGDSSALTTVMSLKNSQD